MLNLTIKLISGIGLALVGAVKGRTTTGENQTQLIERKKATKLLSRSLRKCLLRKLQSFVL